MRNGIFALIVSTSLIGLPFLAGCDREIASETKVKESGDKTTVTEKKVTEKPDGSIEKTTEKKTIDK
jgi:hypothetical protein